MVSALDSRSGDPGSSPGRGHCVVFLGKTLYSQSASLHPGVQTGTSKCAGGNPCDGLASYPGGNSDTPSHFMRRKPELSTGPMGHLGPYKGFTFTMLYFRTDPLTNYTFVLSVKLLILMFQVYLPVQGLEVGRKLEL